MAERMDEYAAGARRPLDAAGGDAGDIETTVIRAEIVETRERMSDTLDEIGERLNPHVIREQVTERVKDGIRDATIGRMEHMARSAADKVSDTRSSMADTIRDNPIPAAMVAVGRGRREDMARRAGDRVSDTRSSGADTIRDSPIPAVMVAVGLGWLMWNGRSDRQQGSRGLAAGRSAYGGPYAAGYAYGGSNPYTGAGDYAGGAYGSGESERGAMERARERAGEATDSVKERAHELADRAHDVAGTVAERTHDLAGTVADRTRRGAGRVEDGFYANPLALGAVAAAVGLAAGLAAPTTDREVQIMGGAPGRLVDTVKDRVQDLAQKA